MKKVHDYVVFQKRGVFEVVDIEKDKTDPEKEYYILTHIEGNMTIKTPVDHENKSIRSVLTKNEMKKLIDDMKDVETVWLSDSRQRSKTYSELIDSGKLINIIKVIKTLYLKNEELKQESKKISFRDKEILNDAERLLFEEVGFVMDIPTNKIEEYILERVS